MDNYLSISKESLQVYKVNFCYKRTIILIFYEYIYCLVRQHNVTCHLTRNKTKLNFKKHREGADLLPQFKMTK